MNESVELYRAENERMRMLLEFLGRPIHAHGGSEPDPDIISAYNLAVEASLHAIRFIAGKIVEADDSQHSVVNLHHPEK